MITLLQSGLTRPKGEPMTKQSQSQSQSQSQIQSQLCKSPWYLRTRWALASVTLVVVAACGGGGGGGGGTASVTPTQAPSANGTTGGTASSTPTAGTSTTTLAVTDAKANELALASMASTPVNAAVWTQLNTAGADSARSLVASTDTVVVSTFKTIVDPTGGPGLIKVFDAVVARGFLNGSRVFQLSSGSLPAGATLVWVNVNGEDFTKNNPGAESALQITVSALGSALVTPLP